MNRALLIPLGFVLFAGILLLALWRGGDASIVPSALIGRPVPVFDLPALSGLDVPGLTASDFGQGNVIVVNVWASWCVPCRAEHPVLQRLALQDGITLYGINYKDDAGAAARFLRELGNPFVRVGADRSGRAGLDWGVYGVPETYIVGADGRIAYKHVGPLTPDALEKSFLPAFRKIKAGAK